MDVLVAGGSLGGLASALALHRLGHEVTIFERSSEQDRSHRGAGIVCQKNVLEFFRSFDLGTLHEISVECPKRQYLNKEGDIIRSEDYTQRMTSWSVLFSRLFKAFPPERYQTSCKVAGFEDKGEKVRVRLVDGRERDCDLLIGADGARSAVRSLLFPEVQRRYAGYAAWRGVVPEKDLSESLARVFVERFTFFHGPGTQILCYLIPGAGGATRPGERDLNWVWYWNYAEGPELDDLLTDSNGHRHSDSLPQGLIRNEVWKKQQQIALQFLAPQFADLVCSTQDPFVQLISDMESPSMVVGRVAIVGEAAFVPRPHTAAAADQAFSNALALHANFKDSKEWAKDVRQVLSDWQESELAYGKLLQTIGQERGNRSQFGDSSKVLDIKFGGTIALR